MRTKRWPWWRLGPGPCTQPGMRRLQHRRHLSPSPLLLSPRPWCSGYTGAILAESLSLFQGETCLEDIPALRKYLDNLSAVLAIAVTQQCLLRLSCSARPVLTAATAPALLCRLFSINDFFLPGIILWRICLPFLLVILHRHRCFSVFSPPPSPKPQAGAVLHLPWG